MKKSILVGLGALTMAIAAVACVGHGNNPIETRADTYSQGSVIPKGKVRIWIGYDTSNSFAKDVDVIKLWIHSTSSGGQENVYTLSGDGGSFNNNVQGGRRYDYFDINESDYTYGWYLTVQRFSGNTWKGSTNSKQLVAANAFQVYYIWGDWSPNNTQGTISCGSIDAVDAGLAAKALGGMHACSDSNLNGYGAFPKFNSTFVKDGEGKWKTSGNLGDYTLTDYPYQSDYKGNPSETVNAYDKYVAVENMYKTGKISGVYNISKFAGSDVNGAAIVGGLAAFGVAAAGTMIFFAKKRKEI